MGDAWNKWNDDQFDYLKRYYGRITREKLKAALDKRGPPHSLVAIKSKATREHITIKRPPGYVNLVDVHPDTLSNGRLVAHWRCKNKAKRDGVTVQEYQSKHAPLLVPEWWAEEYLKCYRDEQDKRTTAKNEKWWSSKQLAGLLGFPPERGCSYLLGRRGPQWWRDGIKDAPKVKMGHQGLMWYVSRKHAQPLIQRWRVERGRTNASHQQGSASANH